MAKYEIQINIKTEFDFFLSIFQMQLNKDQSHPKVLRRMNVVNMQLNCKSFQKETRSPNKPIRNYNPNNPIGNFYPNNPIGNHHPNNPIGNHHPNNPIGNHHPNKQIGNHHQNKASPRIYKPPGSNFKSLCQNENQQTKKKLASQPKKQENYDSQYQDNFLDEKSMSLISDLDESFNQISEVLNSNYFLSEFETEINNSDEFKKALDNLKGS